MTAKFFVDSSVIIRALKNENFQEALHILNILLETKKWRDVKVYINLAVEWEVIGKLAFEKGLLNPIELKIFLSAFDRLYITEDIERDYLKILENYQMEPKDALILATCRFYKIKHLVTFSPVLKMVAPKEKMVCIDKAEKLGKILAKELQSATY